MKADKLIIGNIVTLDARYPILEALTVKDGLVQYAGSLEMAKKLCDENTEVMDYGDNYVYPGFIEAHCHGALAGPRLAFFMDLSAGKSMDDYLGMIKEYIQQHPDNEFYYGAGWAEKEYPPTAEMLDEICSDKVIALNSIDGHSYWFNTKGMEKFGINADAVKQWGTDIIRVKEDGTPTGYISEGPTNSITIQTLQLGKENMKKAMLVWQDFALAHGITAFYEAGANDDTILYVKELIEEGKWKLRLYTGLLLDEHMDDYTEGARQAKALAEKYNNEYFQIIGVKIFMDGVVEAHTAWTIDEYCDMPGYTGVKRFKDFDKTVELYKECAKLGLNVHQHTVGDGAVKFALDCMEAAETETGIMNMRNALCHLQMLRKQDIKRLCDLNAVAVVAPLWMAREEEYYKQSVSYIGEKRTFYGYPLKSFIDNNGIIAFHSDFPVSSQMSFQRSLYMACTRNMPGNDDFYQWNANEVISREDALAGVTTGPAYSVMQENHLGKLQIGYVANMVVYDTNFLSDPLEKVGKAELLATIIDGNVEYKK